MPYSETSISNSPLIVAKKFEFFVYFTFSFLYQKALGKSDTIGTNGQTRISIKLSKLLLLREEVAMGTISSFLHFEHRIPSCSMRPILQWIDKVSEDDNETGFVQNLNLIIHLFSFSVFKVAFHGT